MSGWYFLLLGNGDAFRDIHTDHGVLIALHVVYFLRASERSLELHCAWEAWDGLL